ncbi:L2 [Rhinella marina papillomavirus 1]|nr:L2 [Rhinella marina papillomavirus 1]
MNEINFIENSNNNELPLIRIRRALDIKDSSRVDTAISVASSFILLPGIKGVGNKFGVKLPPKPSFPGFFSRLGPSGAPRFYSRPHYRNPFERNYPVVNIEESIPLVELGPQLAESPSVESTNTFINPGFEEFGINSVDEINSLDNFSTSSPGSRTTYISRTRNLGQLIELQDLGGGQFRQQFERGVRFKESSFSTRAGPRLRDIEIKDLSVIEEEDEEEFDIEMEDIFNDNNELNEGFIVGPEPEEIAENPFSLISISDGQHGTVLENNLRDLANLAPSTHFNNSSTLQQSKMFVLLQDTVKKRRKKKHGRHSFLRHPTSRRRHTSSKAFENK